MSIVDTIRAAKRIGVTLTRTAGKVAGDPHTWTADIYVDDRAKPLHRHRAETEDWDLDSVELKMLADDALGAVGVAPCDLGLPASIERIGPDEWAVGWVA